jgi:hypothetical protein
MVPAEEFEYSVKRFEDPYEKNGNNEVIHYPIPILRKPPVKEKDEEASESQPPKKLYLGAKG